MKKLFNLFGKKVMSACGETIGTICDIAIKKESLLKVQGFLVDVNGEKSKFKFIPWDDFKFGKDVVLLNSVSEPLEIASGEILKDMFKDILLKDDLIDLRVFANDGSEVGILKDMYLSESEGLIDCLQCSDGIINDILNGRTIYPILGSIEINKNNIFIGKECLTEAINRNEMEVRVNE